MTKREKAVEIVGRMRLLCRMAITKRKSNFGKRYSIGSKPKQQQKTQGKKEGNEVCEKPLILLLA